MATVRGSEIVIERGEGVWLWDDEGNRYLDGSASLWYCNVGHGRAEIADAVATQMKQLEAWSIFGDTATPPALELADKLAELSSLEEAKIFLTTGGGDAIDTAAKLSRLYWQVLGQPDRLHIVSRTSAYHGTMAFGTSIGGIEANRAGYGPLVASTSQVQWDSPAALRSELESLGPERVAAFFMEPVIGAGGVLPPPEGYVEAVAEICRETAVLFVCDSVICGFGRLGSWLGFERFGVQPDLVTFAKGVTSGYLPLGGVVVSGRVAEPFWTDAGRVTVRHGQTYSGHATSCAAALANIDILERERLIERGAELEDELLATLAPLAEHPLVAEVRGGTGALVGIAFDQEALASDPSLPARAYRAIRPHGVILRALGDSLAVSPPLTITADEIELIRDAVRVGLDALDSARHLRASASLPRAVAASGIDLARARSGNEPPNCGWDHPSRPG